MKELTIKKHSYAQTAMGGIEVEVVWSNGTATRMKTFPDSIGGTYARIEYRREGKKVHEFEEVVTTKEDSIHRMVTRGIRSVL